MFFKQTFKIFHDNGNIIETDDLLAFIGIKFGAVETFYNKMKFSIPIKKENFWCERYQYSSWLDEDFYLFTSNNVMISPELFKNEYKKYRSENNKGIYYRNKFYTYKQWDHFHFTKGYTCTYTRYFYNFQERKAAATVVKEDGEPEFRGKRRNLPEPWDEKMSRRSLSWKECTKRKRQYKGS